MAKPVGNNPYLQQILFQNMNSSSIQPKQLKDSMELLSSSAAAKTGMATISANGQKINDVSSAIRQTGDMQAYQGMQMALAESSSANNPMKMMRFLNGANFAAKNDSGALADTFSALGRTADIGGTGYVGHFTQAFTAAVDQAGMSGLSSFNRAVSAVEKADYSGSEATMGENMRGLFTAFNQVTSSDASPDEMEANLERLARGVEFKDSADDIWSFFDEFTGVDPTNDLV